MAENIANKDAAFECLEIARAALKAGDHARAERFSQKALKLYRCQQVRSAATADCHSDYLYCHYLHSVMTPFSWFGWVAKRVTAYRNHQTLVAALYALRAQHQHH